MPSKVYYVETKKDEPAESISKKLSRLIEASNVLTFIKKDDFTAVKLHFGEQGNKGHIRHGWVRQIAQDLRRYTKNAFLTDTNVIYKQSLRTNAVDHLKIADEHGFGLKNTAMPVIIADGIYGRNFIEVSVGKKHFDKVKIASDIANCDSMLVLTHATGHMQTGLGGALKNLGMGCASRRGKYEQHCGVVPHVEAVFCSGCARCVACCPSSCIVVQKKRVRLLAESCVGCGECAVVCKTKAIEIRWSETLENLQEKMVEYAYGAIKAVKGNVAFISFIIMVTKDCDCLAKDELRIVDDVGILASRDPVSIDKASIDLMNARSGKDVLMAGYPEANWMIQLKYAAEIGLGNLDYTLERL